LVPAILRTVFAHPDRAAAGKQGTEVVARLDKHFPKAAALLRAAEDDVLAYMSFPREHWTRIYSTNPLERLNREVKRRTDVVQVFPDDAAALRLSGAILLEIADEWAADERRYAALATFGVRRRRRDEDVAIAGLLVLPLRLTIHLECVRGATAIFCVHLVTDRVTNRAARQAADWKTGRPAHRVCQREKLADCDLL